MRLRAGCARELHLAKVAHTDTLEEQHGELHEGVPRKLRRLGGEGTARSLAETLDRSNGLAFEASKLTVEEPLRETDASAGKAEARPEPCGCTTARIGTHRSRDLRLRHLRLARQFSCALRRLGEIPQRHGTRRSVERRQHNRDRIAKLATREGVEHGDVSGSEIEHLGTAATVIVTTVVTRVVATVVTRVIATVVTRVIATFTRALRTGLPTRGSACDGRGCVARQARTVTATTVGRALRRTLLGAATTAATATTTTTTTLSVGSAIGAFCPIGAFCAFCGVVDRAKDGLIVIILFVEDRCATGGDLGSECFVGRARQIIDPRSDHDRGSARRRTRRHLDHACCGRALRGGVR